MICSILPLEIISALAEEETTVSESVDVREDADVVTAIKTAQNTRVAAVEPRLYDYLDVGPDAYIDTGVVPTKDTRVVLDAEVNTDDWAALFGVIWHDNDHGSASHNYYVNSGGTSFGFGFGKEDAKERIAGLKE